MILDIELKPHEICVSYFDKNGDIDYLHLEVKKSERFVWEKCDPADPKRDLDFSTWDGNPVKKSFVSDVRKLNKYRIEEIMINNPEAVKVLHEFNSPRKYFIDIEVEVIDGFPDAETAPNKVTSIAITNSQTNTVNVLAIRPLSEKDCINIERDINKHFEKFNEKWSFRFFYFESEYDMMYTFFKTMVPNFPCMSGWNFTGYDWKYLLNRIPKINKNLPPEKAIKAEWASPSGKMSGKNQYPVHRLIVDYLEIYKKWDRVIKIRENDKLDYVAQQATGIEKIKYPGSIKDLYEKDFVKFIFYNAVDAILVHYIDKKLNTMLTYLKLSQVSGVELKKTFSPIWIMETMMCKEFYKRSQVFLYSPDGADDLEQKAFEGAYVMDPVVGFHEWVTCYDFSSLYPSVMRQFNISPETFVGNNIEPDLEKKEIKVGERTDDKGRTTWRVFQNDKDSILRTILGDLFAKRKATKQKYLEVDKEVDMLTKFLNSTKN